MQSVNPPAASPEHNFDPPLSLPLSVFLLSTSPPPKSGDFTGTGAYTPVTEDRFNIVCGCDGTTAPTTAPARDRDFAGTTPSPASADGVGVASTPSPAGADGVGVVASTPSPAGGDETDTDTAFGANGGPAVAPGPRARLPAIVAVALSAVLMGVL